MEIFNESEFLAEGDQDTRVLIIPLRRIPVTFNLLSGNFGPFEIHRPYPVPLWIGRLLEKRRLCSIEMPEIYSNEKLEELVRSEKRLGVEELGRLPEYFEEVGRMFFRMKSAENTRSSWESQQVLFEDLLSIRKSKILASLKNIDSTTIFLDISRLIASERNQMRLGVCGVLNKLNDLVQGGGVFSQDDEPSMRKVGG